MSALYGQWDAFGNVGTPITPLAKSVGMALIGYCSRSHN